MVSKVSAHFDDPVDAPEFEGKPAIQRAKLNQWLRDRMMRQQLDVEMEHGEQTVLRAIAALAKQIPHKVVLEDQTFKTLTYQRLLVGTDVLAAQWAKRLDPNTERGGAVTQR